MFGCCSRDKKSEIKYEYLHETDKQYYLEALEAEKKVLSHSGLELGEEIKQINVFLDAKKINWIHVIECGLQHSNDESYLLIHGYGSSSASFYKILKELSQYNRVYCIDLLGMNMSSRPTFDIEDPRECIDFFVESIDILRQRLGVKKFLIIGHSFGGYISSQYTLLKKQYVKTLYLISPLGTTKKSKHQVEQIEIQMLENMNILKQSIFHFVLKKAWKNKETPSSFYSSSMFPSSYFIDGYLECRLGITGQPKEDIKNYANKIFNMKISSEKAFHSMFMFPNMMAVFPLEDELANKVPDIPVHIIYGDHNDWMDRIGAKNLINKKLVQGSYNEVKDGTHNVFIDHPEEVLEIILSAKRQQSNQLQQSEIKDRQKNEEIENLNSQIDSNMQLNDSNSQISNNEIQQQYNKQSQVINCQ